MVDRRIATLCVLLGLATVEVSRGQLVGPVQPPPGGAVATQTGTPNDGSWGRPGGKTFSYSNVIHADRSPAVFFGVDEGGVRLSLDGPDTSSPGEVMAYQAGLSDLPNGVVVWSGTTTIITMSTGAETAYTRFQMTVTNQVSGTPVPLVLATNEGLAADVGALAPIDTSATAIDVNMLFTASLNPGGPFVPHLDFFDPLTDATQDGRADSTVVSGFYYVNTPPFITANVANSLDEGDTSPITLSQLAADDYESGAAELTFTIDPDEFGGTPQNGELQLGGSPLGSLGTFTLKDVEDGLLQYVHGGAENTVDSFTFTVKDAEGELARDGMFTVFQHNFSIAPVNDPPTAIDGSEDADFEGFFSGAFQATDPDSSPLTFSVESVDVGIANLLDANAGTFEYQAPNGFVGDASITFQVSDGSLSSAVPGTFVVSVPDPSLDDVDAGDVLIGDGDRLLLYNVPEDTVWPLSTGGSLTDVIGVAADRLGRIFVLDGDNGIVQIDPETGAQTPISPGSNFAMETPGSLEVENVDSLLVAEVPSGVLRVAIVDGGVSTVASGDLLAAATALAIGPGGTVYVTDAAGFIGGTSEVVEVDPSNGNQSSVSLGGDLLVPLAVAVERNGTILVADVGTLAASTNKILRIDPGDSGSQTPLASGDFITDLLSDVEVGRFGEIYVGARSEGLIAVDPTTGAQTLLVGAPSVNSANAIAVVPPEIIKVEDFENGIGDWTEVVPP